MQMPRLSARQTTALLSGVGVLIVVWGAYLAEPGIAGTTNFGRIFSTVVLSVGGSLTASAIAAFLVLTYNEIGFRRRKLRAFLGVRNPSKDVAIVIPRFPYTRNVPPTNQGAPEGLRCKEAIKDAQLTNRYSLAFDDLAAVRHISAVFVELKLAPPRIEFDDDAWDSLFLPPFKGDRLANYKAFIVVGLFSNEVTMELATRSDEPMQRYFRLSSKADFYASRRAVSICPYGVQSTAWHAQEMSDWDIPITSSLSDDPEKLEREPDFALIAKCRAVDGRSCLLVGGGRSRGTRKAGSYLRQSWEMLFEHQGEKPGDRTKANAFAAAFRLAGNRGARLQPQGHRLTDTPL